MDSNLVDEDGILPILNQVKAFQSKWIAKNKQCDTLDSFLTTANAENRQLRDNLNAANIKINELEDECENLRLSTVTIFDESKRHSAECEALKNSLDITRANMEELRVKYQTSESALIVSNNKNEDLERKCREVEVKYAVLESSLLEANAKIKNLEVRVKECKKEVVKTKLEKKRVIISTLKKFQNKLLTNPLYAIIDRLKHNIEALDEAAKNTSQNLRNKEIEVVDIASSDDDDRSTLSFTSELCNMEEDFSFDVDMSPDCADRQFNHFYENENVQLAEQISNTESREDENIQLDLQISDSESRENENAQMQIPNTEFCEDENAQITLQISDSESQEDENAQMALEIPNSESREGENAQMALEIPNSESREGENVQMALEISNSESREGENIRVQIRDTEPCEDENTQPAVQISLNTDVNNEQTPVESVTREPEVQNMFIDNTSCDSNIILSVCTDDVTSTTAEEHLNLSEISSALIAEEHSYSGKSLLSPGKSVPETASSECTSTVVNDQLSSVKENQIENHVSDDNPVLSFENRDKILDSENTPVSTNVNEIPECNNECPSFKDQKRLEVIIANMRKQTGKNLILLHPVVLLTPVDECERVKAKNLIEVENSH